MAGANGEPPKVRPGGRLADAEVRCPLGDPFGTRRPSPRKREHTTIARVGRVGVVSLSSVVMRGEGGEDGNSVVTLSNGAPRMPRPVSPVPESHHRVSGVKSGTEAN